MPQSSAYLMVVVVRAAGTLIQMDPLNRLDADMKTHQEMVYDFMLALAPNFQAMYDDCMKDGGYKHKEAFESTLEEICIRAEKLALAYLEGEY